MEETKPEKVNALTVTLRLRLQEYLAGVGQQGIDNNKSRYWQLAEQATSAMGFRVTKENVKTTMKGMGLKSWLHSSRAAVAKKTPGGSALEKLRKQSEEEVTELTNRFITLETQVQALKRG